MYLQDLTFIEDGNPDVVNGPINFAKRTMVFKILDQISTIQQDGYNLAVVEDMRYVRTAPCIRQYLGVGVVVRWCILLRVNDVLSLWLCGPSVVS